MSDAIKASPSPVPIISGLSLRAANMTSGKPSIIIANANDPRIFSVADPIAFKGSPSAESRLSINAAATSVSVSDEKR